MTGSWLNDKETDTERQRVNSSDLQSVGYDPNTGTLEIRFHSGGTYKYFGIPARVYSSLVGAASHGRYFHRCIKGAYRYSKVG